MIDNFEVIRPLLVYPKPGDTFYFVQVLQRKKDNPGMRLGGSNNNARLIRAYYVESLEYFDSRKEEMVKLAEVFNARVGINLNPRSYEKASFQLLQKLANQMSNKDFKGSYQAYNSVCGNYHAEADKRWLVDIDTKDQDFIDNIKTSINKLQEASPNKSYSVMAQIETKNGYHLITNPFNSEKFGEEFPGVEVHKNNPTALYIP